MKAFAVGLGLIGQSKKDKVNKKKFVEAKDLERNERNKNITAGVVAIGLFAGEMGFLIFMKEFCKKDLLKWIICVALFVVVFAAFWVYKLFNGITTAKKAYLTDVTIYNSRN